MVTTGGRQYASKSAVLHQKPSPGLICALPEVFALPLRALSFIRCLGIQMEGCHGMPIQKGVLS